MNMPFNLLILKVFHAQKNQVRPRMAAIGLSPGQPKVLTFLALHGACLQKELAAACDIEPTTISKMLNNLEEKALVRRSALPGDKRAALIKLTTQGRTLVEMEILPRYNSVNSRSLKDFTAEEREQFEQFLRRMYDNLTGTPLDFQENLK